MTLKKRVLTHAASVFAARFFLTMGMIFGTAVAQTTMDADELLYVVQPGDTLYDISEQYLEDPRHWRGLAQKAQVKDPTMLQPGKVIRLPIDLLRHEQKEVRVAFQRGQAAVVKGSESKPLVRGMILREGQTIKTGTDGFVSLVLPDDSRLFLAANSVLKINQFRYVPDAKRELIEFVLEEGSVETTVTSQEPNSRFRVSTPLTVTGVRGTEFGVTFDRQSGAQTNNVTQGSVAVSVVPTKGRAAQQPMSNGVTLSAGQGAVMTATMTTPQVGDLLPAPDLSGWPQYVHSETWTPEISATGLAKDYVVRVSPVNAPEEVIFDSHGALVPIGPIKEDGAYQVQVRALDANKVPGSIATHIVNVKTKPAAPLLQGPENDAELVVTEQNLVCTNAPGISRYALQVAQDELFANKVLEQVSDNGCRFNLKLPLGAYVWRVTAVDNSSSNVDAASGAYSAVGNFVVVPVPKVPTVAQERDDKGVLLRWAEETPGSTYVVQVSDDVRFLQVLSTHETDQTKVTLDIAHSCTKIYVRIKSIEPNGNASEFSDARELQTTYTWCTADGQSVVDQQGKPVRSQ